MKTKTGKMTPREYDLNFHLISRKIYKRVTLEKGYRMATETMNLENDYIAFTFAICLKYGMG